MKLYFYVLLQSLNLTLQILFSFMITCFNNTTNNNFVDIRVQFINWRSDDIEIKCHGFFFSNQTPSIP